MAIKKMTVRELMAKKKTIICPEAYDALSALMIEKTGYDMVWITGLGLAGSILGVPDIGLTTASDVIRSAAAIAQVVNIPVLCDIDTGFGGATNVWRTIREMEAAGVRGVHMEDQTFPKRCGYLPGKQVIPVEDYLEKLRAAVDARKNKEDFIIVTRTDCKEPEGMDSLIRRLNIYADNGADLGMSGSLHTFDELKRMTREVKIPILAGSPADPAATTVKQWEEAGVKIVLYWTSLLFSSMKAQLRTLEMLRTKGSLAQMKEDFISYPEYLDIVKEDWWGKVPGKHKA